MRGKKICFIFAVCLAVMLTGCNGTKDSVSKSQNVVKTTESATQKVSASTMPEATVTVSQEIDVKLYLPDDNAEYLTYSFEKTDGTPEDIISDLVDAGALPSGTAMNYFTLYDNGEHIELDDEVAAMSENLTAELDMNTSFADAVEHTGTAGEAMYMGSLVNTLIEYYNLKSILITANGETIETGHSVYDEPLTFYSDLISE